jgi:hypothetical protein
VAAILLLIAGASGQQHDEGASLVRLTRDASGALAYFIAAPSEKSGYRDSDSELVVWAFQEWQRRVGGPLKFARADSEAAATLRVHFLPWSEEAALGRMDPATIGGRTVASIDIRPDEFRFRPTVRRRIIEDPLMRDVVVYYVCLHEIGHALGLRHSNTPADIMWPGVNGVTLPVYDRYRHRIETRADIPGVEWLSHDDVARARALWAAR